MFQFKESSTNPIDQLAYAKSLIAFLNDLASQSNKEVEILKNGVIGLSIILEIVGNILDDVEGSITKRAE